MSGPTLTVTVPVESTQSLQSLHSHSHPRSPPRSPSNPDLATASAKSQSSTVALPLHNHSRSYSTSDLPNIPTFDVPSFNFDTEFDTSFSFSSDRPQDSTNEKPTPARAEKTMAGSDSRTGKIGKKRTMFSRPQSWMPLARSSVDIAGSPEQKMEEKHVAVKDAGNPNLLSPNPPEKPRNVSDSLASFAKRSWMPSSRSPSPGENKDEPEATSDARIGRGRSASNSSIMKLRRSSRKRPASPAGSDSGKSTDSRGKLGTYLSKIKHRPQNMLAKGKLQADVDSPASSTASIAPPSTDTRRSHASETSNSTYPEDTTVSSRRPQSRDPLWLPFKGLETDYHRLQSRSTSLKMNLIRSTLVPFLKKYANHSSNKTLHYEDLERRAVILNKWWNGLLEILDGKTHQPVSGVDRPVLLETMAVLMMRPEWRQCSTSFTPLADRKSTEHVRRRSQTMSGQSSTSIDSTDSAYIAESAGHNVRTMFVTNLVTQMAIVVEKLSIRHAPLSLVNFAGKACAYAFFFAPGIADVLVRLWALTPDAIRRVAEEFGLSRRSRGESDDTVAFFPPCVDSLVWTSVRSTVVSLKRAASLPLTAAKIPWHGPWVSRWRGRDTDLFFIFCKYFYLLAEEFFPPDLPLLEKARAPGFALVNAQILSVLDSTIHRQAAVEAMMGPPLADAVHGTDASLMAMPAAPNNNIMKGMNENRLIVLLKDFLSATSVLSTGARHTFSESFMVIMKATAKRTSQFDHNACFTICDFLEESLVAYDSFVDIQRPNTVYVDWSFWFEVWKKIMESNNTMSEIRVLSLIFSIWEAISSDQSRKESICLDWLLTEEVFSKLFNNWCPMVRAYYMRLLCWRICRDSGSANDSDAKIFLTVSSRLKTVWSHYLWLKQAAEQQSKFPPSTAPSFPTPGKRFMIIRTELPPEQPGLIVGFDTFTSASRPSQPDPGTCAATDFESMDTLDAEPSSPQRKKWGLFGKVLSFTNNTTVDNDLEAVRRETAASRTRPALPPKGPSTTISPTTSDSDSMGSAPTFEASQFIFRFTLSWNAAGTMSPPNRVLTRPRLPGPAQSCVTWKAHSTSQSQPPPPPAAGPPAPTRAVSGSPSQGLINSAKNADSSEVSVSPHRIDMTFGRRDSFSSLNFNEQSSDDQPLANSKNPTSPSSPTQEPIIKPVEPRGIFVGGVKYAGRALAEWSLVVAECNSFIERRRDEGVLGLSDIEVPSLGVEGFRKMG
ncbi:DUF1765-domain-containing protein [Whalleya microplaca]|nr:DUF1765-domain-containing protein [Whalleya microplaca]